MTQGITTSLAPECESARVELLRSWSRQFRRPLLRFFQRRMPVDADCEDLVQDVFVKLARRDDLAKIERVDSYLFEAATNTLRDWRRRRITHAAAAAHVPISDEIPEVDLSPERILAGKESLQVLIDAVAALPERTRMVFLLYHFEGLSHAEISRRLGIALRTVEDHMNRANVRLLALRRAYLKS